MEASKFSVFNCDSSRQVLMEYLNNRQQSDFSFSLRGWARELGFNSHTLLQFWIKGKRKIKPHHAPILSRSMAFTKNEEAYFESLVLIDNAKNESERECLIRNLANFDQHDQHQVRVVEEFRVLSHWIHMALLALREFSENEAHSRFGHLVRGTEIDSAILRLEKMQLLARTPDNRYRARESSVTTRNDVADSGAREYFKNVSDLAKDAVEKQSVEEREFQGLTLHIDKKDLPLAKKLIRKFRREFNSAVGGGSDIVYQMNLQFFQLSRKPAVPSHEGCDGKK